MAENKTPRITKAQKYAAIKELLSGQDEAIVTAGSGENVVRVHFTVDDAITFIDHEVGLLTKKNSTDTKKMTETQKQNEVYKEAILDFLGTVADPGATCTEIGKKSAGLADFTVNKISALVRQLKTAGLVTNSEVKGKMYFKLA